MQMLMVVGQLEKYGKILYKDYKKLKKLKKKI
jgi:hypothetical protein